MTTVELTVAEVRLLLDAAWVAGYCAGQGTPQDSPDAPVSLEREEADLRDILSRTSLPPEFARG